MAVLGDALAIPARMARVCLVSALAVILGSILVRGAEGIPLPPCLFREITGMSCLTCGLTRSLEAASQGLLQAAFQFHLLGPFVLVGIVALALAWAVEALRGKRFECFREARRQRHAFLGVVVIWMVYGAGRMIVELM